MDVIKKLCKEGKNTINVVGKVLKDKEKDELRELINTEVKEEVIFENENELGLHGIKKVYEQNVENSETYFFKGGIRSGQKLEFDGSIVVCCPFSSTIGILIIFFFGASVCTVFILAIFLTHTIIVS